MTYPSLLRRYIALWIDLAVRLVVKDLLGVISFFLLPRQKQRRALHDLASGTIMLEASDAKRLSAP